MIVLGTQRWGDNDLEVSHPHLTEVERPASLAL